ncbi:GNAT family N-acetyltransferase [Histidinibacterium lentulum]|uniref:GNAT family N-acetyltransferase n=1 Tax=Histidinibacterium lentulum TaxID=2480588 RepID=A0A3N2R6R5_9RHOB|nr:GNAT family N-acetyltransferase [Histidinibacterium lentulum]ROU03083.1 GNAT family N-acetyltransferase [Histidinibacterium lentulum]
MKSLGLESDLVSMTGLQRVETHADRIVVRTPSEPDYWFGNLVIFRHGRIDPAVQVAQSREDLPEARHVVLQWDAPGLEPDAAEAAALKTEGLEVERDDVLTLDGAPHGPPPPAGIVLRRIENDGDWAQVLALQLEVGLEEGHEDAAHRPFLARRYANARRQAEQGLGARFGAFDDDLLVADMGIVLGARLARFQTVATRASHRRRGLCAALLAQAGGWARARAPGAVLVIVAQSGSAAGRIYHRAGFGLAETILSAVRRPE